MPPVNPPFFGGFGQQQTAAGTAHVKYNPVVGTDVMLKSGAMQNINIKHHCITCMKEYENKSLEELRLEDYTAGRKGAQAGVFGGFGQPAEAKPLFGGSTFGQPATTTAPSVFGGGGLGGATTGFGQNSVSGQQTIAVGTTHVKYNSETIFEMIEQPGASKIMKYSSQNITCMNEYRNKSQEELRLEDYAAYRSVFGGSNLFGSPWPGFGTASSGFSTTWPDFSAPSSFGSTKPSFGSTKPSFGATKPGFGVSFNFGATKPDFGASRSFGATETSFGATKPSFGATKPSFGATYHSFGATKNVFGTTPSNAEISFGTKPTFQFKPIEGELNGGLFGDTCRKGAPLVTLGATNSSVPMSRSEPSGLTSDKINRVSMEYKNGNNLLNVAHKTSTLSEIVTFLNDFKIGKDYKVSLVYECHDCGLSFDRLDFLTKHFNTCSPDRRLVKIHCICGLVFDRQNYDYHREVHRKFTLLKVKEIALRDKVRIDVSGMTEEFVENNKLELQSKEAANLSQASQCSVEENDIENNETKETTAD